MSNLIRWDPMRGTISLREAMDRLFEDAFTHPFAPISGLQMPVIDLYQTDEEVVVRATLPGIKAEEVKISLTGDMLTIKGELKEKEELKEPEEMAPLEVEEKDDTQLQRAMDLLKTWKVFEKIPKAS